MVYQIHYSAWYMDLVISHNEGDYHLNTNSFYQWRFIYHAMVYPIIYQQINMIYRKVINLQKVLYWLSLSFM